jgi:hypothetical protein
MFAWVEEEMRKEFKLRKKGLQKSLDIKTVHNFNIRMSLNYILRFS